MSKIKLLQSCSSNQTICEHPASRLISRVRKVTAMADGGKQLHADSYEVGIKTCSTYFEIACFLQNTHPDHAKKILRFRVNI